MSEGRTFRAAAAKMFDGDTCLAHSREHCADCFDAAYLISGRPRRGRAQGGATKGRRIYRARAGTVTRVTPRKGGAFAQCAWCQWGEFIEDNSRKRYSPMARAAAALREHARREHADKVPKLYNPSKETLESES
jgi:hypothetical protein